MAFVAPVMEHWLEREISHGSTMMDRYDPSHHEILFRPPDNSCRGLLVLYRFIRSHTTESQVYIYLLKTKILKLTNRPHFNNINNMAKR